MLYDRNTSRQFSKRNLLENCRAVNRLEHWPISLSLWRTVVASKHFRCSQYVPMSEFEPWTSLIRSDHPVNCATVLFLLKERDYDQKRRNKMQRHTTLWPTEWHFILFLKTMVINLILDVSATVSAEKYRNKTSIAIGCRKKIFFIRSIF